MTFFILSSSPSPTHPKPSEKKTSSCCHLLLPLLTSSQESTQKSSVYKELRKVGTEKEGKKAAVFRYPLLLCFSSSCSLKRKSWKPSVYKGWKGIERRRRGRKIACSIISCMTAAGLRIFLYSFCPWECRKMGFFRGWEGVGRGERRWPWGTKPQDPENLMLFCF